MYNKCEFGRAGSESEERRVGRCTVMASLHRCQGGRTLGGSRAWDLGLRASRLVGSTAADQIRAFEGSVDER
jgi:hypothetical protein